MLVLLYFTSPTTTLLLSSTTVTDGYLPKLCVITQDAEAISKHFEKVPALAIISAKSSIVHTLDGTAGHVLLATTLTTANGSTNTPTVSVATTTLLLDEFFQSHKSFWIAASSKSV